MQNIFNNVKSSGLKVAEYFIPVLKESKFHETGVLTPEEFVYAGDHLVHHCPTWQWATGDESCIKDYLPREKQFLITRNVPCYKRCSQMEYASEQEKVLEEEDGWVDTHHYSDKDVSDKVGEMKLEERQPEVLASAIAQSDPDDDDDDDEAVDMDDFVESGMIDTATVDTKKAVGAESSAAAAAGEIEKVRTYDLNITYDKYYQTPRLWLFGYDESRKALTVDEMYEDFSADHANKTITMEAHPHLPGPPQASVHPCRHAQVMKKLIDRIVEGGGELGVHMYLIVFLKFVQAIIPTMEYDFTQNFAM